jgi:hypothetical protein
MDTLLDIATAAEPAEETGFMARLRLLWYRLETAISVSSMRYYSSAGLSRSGAAGHAVLESIGA